MKTQNKLKQKLQILSIALTLFVISCNATETTEKTVPPEPHSDNTGINTTETTNSSIQKVEILSFDPNSLKEISSQIPAEISYTGDLAFAYGWNDKNGKNILLNYYVESEFEAPEFETSLSSTAYTMHYVYTNEEYLLMFENKEEIKDCLRDIMLHYKTRPLIEDSDNNGVAEVTECIIKWCISGQSPASLSVVMHENKSIYTLRGYEYFTSLENDSLPSDFQYNETIYSRENNEIEDYFLLVSGRYHNNTDFKNAPQSFFLTAEKIWKENVFREMQ